MPLTGSCAEVFWLTLPEEVELDTDQPLSRQDLVSSYRERFTPLPEDERLDVDVDDNVF